MDTVRAFAVTKPDSSIFYLPRVLAFLTARNFESCLLPRKVGQRIEFESRRSEDITIKDLQEVELLAQDENTTTHCANSAIPPSTVPHQTLVFLPWIIEQLPPQFVHALIDGNYSELLGRTRDGLVHYRFLPEGERSFSSFLGQCRRTFRKVASAAGVATIKVLLRFVGADVRRFGVSELPCDGGFCYRAAADALSQYADDQTKGRSPFLLFEEHHQLVGHSGHDEVRSIGRGRFSHWGTWFYFSATDNSNPNGNLKRYRVFPRSARLSFIKPIMRAAVYFSSLRGRHPMADRGTLLSKPVRSKPLNFTTGIIELAAETAASPAALDRTEIHQLIGTLGVGGAERQLCNLAFNLSQRGGILRVFTFPQPDPESLHYAPWLKDRQIPHHFADPAHPRFALHCLPPEKRARVVEMLSSLPYIFAREVLDLFSHLCVHRPQVLHCWLDHTNLIGAIAAALAGVPRIIVSTRNVNPTNFPFNREWYREWYQVVAQFPNVAFIANSRAGADDYAKWLSLPPSQFRVVHNGLDLKAYSVPSASAIQGFRQLRKVSEGELVIVGVLRLAPEKRPLDFLKVIATLRSEGLPVRAFIAGAGPLEKEVRAGIDELQLQGTVELLGTTREISTVISAADIVLLTSEVEGLPNALIEAQWFERPVVCTSAGGCAEVVLHGQTGFVCPVGAIAELARYCRTLLLDPKLRKSFGIQGKEHALASFGLDSMVNQSVALYDYEVTSTNAASSAVPAVA